MRGGKRGRDVKERECRIPLHSQLHECLQREEEEVSHAPGRTTGRGV